MNAIDVLREKLTQYKDLDSAAQVYSEANALANQFKRLAQDALDIALERMPIGTLKARTESGHSVGYTRPQSKRLNKAKWDVHLKLNPEIAARYIEAQNTIAELQQPFMAEPDARFYIKAAIRKGNDEAEDA
jgi:hypothetical protein